MINSTSVLEIMETEQSLPSNRDVAAFVRVTIRFSVTSRTKPSGSGNVWVDTKARDQR